MVKYKQRVIPKTSTSDIKHLSKKELQKFTQQHYAQNLQGKARVVNKDIGITIEFVGTGKRKTSYGAAMYHKKAAVVKVLDKVVKYAEYSNWGNRKTTDKPNIIGYLNFKVKVYVDNALCHFAINVQVRNDGKFHYSLDENRLQRKKPPA